MGDGKTKEIVSGQSVAALSGVSIKARTAPITEGEPAVVMLELSRSPKNVLVLLYTVVERTAERGSDFTTKGGASSFDRRKRHKASISTSSTTTSLKTTRNSLFF